MARLHGRVLHWRQGVVVEQGRIAESILLSERGGRLPHAADARNRIRRRAREKGGVHELALRVITQRRLHQIGKLLSEVVLAVLAVVEAPIVIL